MRTTFIKRSPISKGGVISTWRLAVAGVLLVGLIILGYGYFRQNEVGFYLGLIVILAGVLNGIIQIIVRGNR